VILTLTKEGDIKMSSWTKDLTAAEKLGFVYFLRDILPNFPQMIGPQPETEDPTKDDGESSEV